MINYERIHDLIDIDELNHLIYENVFNKNLEIVSALRHQEKFLNTPDGLIYIDERKKKIRIKKINRINKRN